MDMTTSPKAAPDGPCCPFLQPALADWVYPVAGYCKGLPRGLLMIPSVAEYRSLCSSGDHAACPIFRYRQGDKGAEGIVRSHYRAVGRFSPLEGLFGSQAESLDPQGLPRERR